MGAAEQGIVRARAEVAPGFWRLELQADPRVVQASGPGRYAMVALGGGTDPYLPRPLWLRRSGEAALSLLVRAAGRGGAWLARRAVGETLRFSGPHGAELRPEPPTRRLLLTGDRAGLNCLLALADEAARRGLEVALLPADPEESVPAALLPPDVELLRTPDPELLTWADELYAVGAPGAVERAQAMLRASGSRVAARGVPHVGLACSVGACYGCVVQTRRGARLSCADGPAFPLRDLVWT